MSYRIHEKLFEIICLDVKLHCETGTVDAVDWSFIEELPEMAEIFGFDTRFGTEIKMRLHAIIRCPAHRRKEEGIPYRYDPRVGTLIQEGYSVREVVELLDSTKAHVERSLREFRALPVQLLFDFFFDVEVLAVPTPVVEMEPAPLLNVSIAISLFEEPDAA